MPEHVCRVNGCGLPIERKYLMCGRHWSFVSCPLQRTIWRLWNDGYMREGYAEACRSAIEQVEARLAAREGQQ